MDNIKKLIRTTKLAEVLIKYGLEELLDRSGIEKFVPESVAQKSTTIENIRSNSLYERIRMAMEELGPAYVKLGQMFSNRSDILPQELVVELQKLQDDVEIQPINVREKIRQELAINPDDHFLMIESEPMASASIGQVFNATLANGQKVVLKIKRDGIEETIISDLLIIKDLGSFLEKRKDIFKRMKLSHMLEAFENSLKKEMSFTNEIANIERFAMNFKNEKRIVIPNVYQELSNNNILCMDFVEGIKVSDKEALASLGYDSKQIAVLGLDLYLKQVLEHGYFHADPHPGNIFVTSGAKIAFIDFGAMGSLLPRDRELIENLVLYCVQKNTKRIVSTIKEIALDYSVPNEKQLEKDIYELINFVEGSSLESVDLEFVLQKSRVIFANNQITLPENVYLLIKGIGQIEGIGRSLDPNLDIFKVMQPYAQQVIARRLSPKYLLTKGLEKVMNASETWLSLPEEMRTFLQKIQNKEIRHKHELSGLSDLQKTFERLVLAMILSSLFIGSSILVLADMPPKVYGIPFLGFVGFVFAGFLGLYMIFKRR